MAAVKTERHDDHEINELAKKIAEQNRAKMTAMPMAVPGYPGMPNMMQMARPGQPGIQNYYRQSGGGGPHAENGCAGGPARRAPGASV